jgi:hypothetical protein
MVEPFTIDHGGRVILKDDHQAIIKKATDRGRMTTGDDPKHVHRYQRHKQSKVPPEVPNLSDTDPLSDMDDNVEEPPTAAMAVSDKRLPDPKSFTEAMKSTEADLWRLAIEEEKASLEQKHTWDIVSTPKDVKPITSKFVFKRKYGPDGQVTRHKARLVARGFQQEEGIDYEETFAAVVKPASYRILFALAAIYGWSIHQADVKTAFLNSSLPKPVYMRPPKGVDLPRCRCFLVLRAIYGLKQSPRAWYQKFRDAIQTWGWRTSAYDPCVFIQDDVRLILQLHVDDMTIFGSNLQAILDFKAQLTETFLITDEGECSWYLGMHVEQKLGEVHIHQQ